MIRRTAAAVVLAFGLGCSGAGMTPVQTAEIVTSATASVLQLVALVLSQVSAAAADQAAKCVEVPDECVLPEVGEP